MKSTFGAVKKGAYQPVQVALAELAVSPGIFLEIDRISICSRAKEIYLRSVAIEGARYKIALGLLSA